LKYLNPLAEGADEGVRAPGNKSRGLTKDFLGKGSSTFRLPTTEQTKA
jgi:hypothetical protein